MTKILFFTFGKKCYAPITVMMVGTVSRTDLISNAKLCLVAKSKNKRSNAKQFIISQTSMVIIKQTTSS